MELLRRIVLLVCVLGGASLCYLVSLKPVIIVEPHIVEKEQQEAQAGTSGPGTENEGFLSAPLIDRRHRESRRQNREDRIIVVDGPQWSAFFGKVINTLQGRGTDNEWSRRLPSGSHPMKALFFHPDEYPLNTLPEIMHKTANRVYLKIITQDGPLYLNADYREYSNNDFHLGSGLSSYPKPPSFFLYPYRIPGLICIIGGILFYILLPCRARAANVLRYDRWRIMLGDFLAALFCAVPLVLPILIVGGTVQAITNGWPLFIFFCPLFICGIFLLWVAAWWGSYQIALLDQGIEVSSFAGKRFYAFGDMAHFQPVIFKAPRWLTFISWAAVFASTSSSAPGAAGRALILSSASTGSIGIGLRTGATLFVTVTDQMGNTALKGFEGIIEALRTRGVKELGEIRIVRSLGMEIVRFDTGATG